MESKQKRDQKPVYIKTIMSQVDSKLHYSDDRTKYRDTLMKYLGGTPTEILRRAIKEMAKGLVCKDYDSYEDLLQQLVREYGGLLSCPVKGRSKTRLTFHSYDGCNANIFSDGSSSMTRKPQSGVNTGSKSLEDILSSMYHYTNQWSTERFMFFYSELFDFACKFANPTSHVGFEIEYYTLVRFNTYRDYINKVISNSLSMCIDHTVEEHIASNLVETDAIKFDELRYPYKHIQVRYDVIDGTLYIGVRGRKKTVYKYPLNLTGDVNVDRVNVSHAIAYLRNFVIGVPYGYTPVNVRERISVSFSWYRR